MKCHGILLAALTCLALLPSCQKFNLDEEEGLSDTEDPAKAVCLLKGTGQGTMEYPYTVEQFTVATLPATDNIWVIGYAVGSAYRTMNAASFSASAEHDNNLLLSSDSLCQDTAHCIPVQFTSTSMKQSFSLLCHPEGFRQCILLQGTPGIYLYKKGLRNSNAGHWLTGFNLSAITPEAWEEQTY